MRDLDPASDLGVLYSKIFKAHSPSGSGTCQHIQGPRWADLENTYRNRSL